MRVLVTGAAGQLGVELLRTAPAGIDTLGVSHAECDISDAKAVSHAFATHHPQLVINTAAFTKVDAAEDQPDLARAINAEGARNVTVAAKGIGARTIHISTDYVFDGTRNSPYSTDSATNPLSVYGATKLEGERAVLETGPGALVVRTGWLYAAHGTNFVRTILAALKTRDLRVVNDQLGVPTSARELAEALWSCAAQPEIRGIQHWVNRGKATWYDFAVRIQEQALILGLIQTRRTVTPVTSSEYPQRARRPRVSILDATVLWDTLGRQVNPWEVALSTVLTEIAQTDQAV